MPVLDTLETLRPSESLRAAMDAVREEIAERGICAEETLVLS